MLQDSFLLKRHLEQSLVTKHGFDKLHNSDDW